MGAKFLTPREPGLTGDGEASPLHGMIVISGVANPEGVCMVRCGGRSLMCFDVYRILMKAPICCGYFLHANN